jgi:hypothetical protein
MTDVSPLLLQCCRYAFYLFSLLSSCSADGRLYFYNLKYDASQWDLPTSDELSEAEANTLKSLAAAGGAAVGGTA